MTVHARPEPADAPRLHAPSSQQLLITAQRQHDQTAGLLERLERHYAAACAPAQLRGPYRLTASSPKRVDDVGRESPSIGVYNPNPVIVYLGLGGVPAEPNRGAVSVPASGLLVLPVSCSDLELGVDPTDPDLAAGDAVVTVLRFETVQPTFVGGV